MKVNQNNRLFKLVGVILAVIVIFLTIRYLFPKGGAESDGTITFQLVDEHGKMIINDELAFFALKDDGTNTTLLDILVTHYNVVCGAPDASCKRQLDMGHFILSIEEVETNFVDYFLEIRINDAFVQAAIDLLEFKDGDVLTITKKKV